MSSSPPAVPPLIQINLATIPALLTHKGVKEHIVEIGKTALYEAASAGEIQSVSVGMGKQGRRLWVASSIVDWLNRRAQVTKRPYLASRRSPESAEKGGR